MLNNALMRFCFSSSIAIAMSGCILDHKSESAATEFPEDVDVLLFGEIHGTTESPLIFKQYVEKMARLNSSPIVVGLEIPSSALKDAKKAGAQCTEIKACAKSLLDSKFWAQSKDGKSSQAYFDLIADLSKLDLNGEIILIGIDARQTGREAFGEMVAQELKPFLRSAKAILLIGNGHAHFDETPNEVPSALQKMNMRVASVLIQSTGGTAWICSDGRCGIQPIRPQDCTTDLDHLKLVRGAETNVCAGHFTASQPLVDVIAGAMP